MTSFKYFTPSQTIQKSYLRLEIDKNSFCNFREKLSELLKTLDLIDREETNKGRVKTFLEQTFWSGKDYEVNGGAQDLWIKDKSIGRNVVLFEFKKVGDSGMPTVEKLNRKGLHELVLYYIIEELENANTSIKHLIITDGYQYFVFEKSLFWDLFGSDKAFVKEVLRSEHTSDERRKYIYDQIIRPKVEKVESKLKFTYFDLKSVAEHLEEDKIFKDSKFKAIYKFFTPIHLQKLSFHQDHNTLNRNFYAELLYIMGLEERGEKHRIQRLKESERQPYSLMEQVYSLLDDYDVSEETGDGELANERFETALGLVIVWINRTLFMKLLESQLISFNPKERDKYAFFRKLTDFPMMHYLFCKVMAIPEKNRDAEMKEKFDSVPYLNSSLFELSGIEKKYFPISALCNGEVEIMKNSALKDDRGKVKRGRICILDYLNRFLDSYNFGTGADENGKTLINASVLGLIFEKINGYKDGSFFTPGYVTSYICREVIRRCVVDKFNETFNTEYETFSEISDGWTGYTDKESRSLLNRAINNLRICDPAVGSGHFIVSALNELVSIKRELNILQFADGKRFPYNLTIEDDELIVSDEDGEEFRYNPSNPESQKIQETLFEEKRTIIENCLFGVDINPNSVEICQLRLWIELLKNAYYIKNEEGVRRLQTLPNIDINIKCGNSIVMKYDLDTPIGQVLRGSNLSIAQYRSNVGIYKNCPSKENKRRVEADILSIKSKLDEGYDKDSADYKMLVKVSANILQKGSSLFPDDNDSKLLTELRKKQERLCARLEEHRTRHRQLDSFEWRYEFPEILSDKGDFIGFDCIIGNPPYGISMSEAYRKTVEGKLKHAPDYEIYYYFIEIGYHLLKRQGYLGYIIPNMWLMNVGALPYRKALPDAWSIVELIDCTSFQIFESATVRNSIVTLQKTTDNDGITWYRSSRDLSDTTLEGKKSVGRDYFQEIVSRPRISVENDVLTKDFVKNWHAALTLDEDEKKIIGKLLSSARLLSDYFDVTQGYIPYREKDLIKDYGKEEGMRIKEQALWHSNKKIDNDYYIEVHGEDISKYFCKPSETYVKYGRHVGTYVDMKYFTGHRLLVQEVLNPLTACLVDETFVNKPDIIDIIRKESNDTFSLEILWAILNSRIANYFAIKFAPKADKGAFPKILITDIRNFPLPERNSENEGIFKRIEELAGKIMDQLRNRPECLSAVEALEWEIDCLVFNLYGVIEDAEIVEKGFMKRNPFRKEA